MNEAADPTSPLEGSAAYTVTVGLVGQVIALQGVQIARERARPRPDREAIKEWESARGAAVMVCRRLSSADPDGVERACREYSRLYRQLVTAQAVRAPWATRQVMSG
jgi:hypothetical protein